MFNAHADLLPKKSWGRGRGPHVFIGHSHVMAWLASLAKIRELARRLSKGYGKVGHMIPAAVNVILWIVEIKE